MNWFPAGSCRLVLSVFGVMVLAASLRAQSPGVVLVRHAPSVNGTIDGSVQQMTAEGATLNGGAVITGNLLVPGTPTLRLNGKPNFGGTVSGAGSSSPTNYTITLNGNAQLGHLVTQTDAMPLPTVEAPPAPTGTRTVNVNNTSQANIDFDGLRNLTLNGNVGAVAVPPGTYGDFSANGSSGFVLGVTGSTVPAVYNFQHLVLNGSTQLQVVGPITLTIANGLSLNGKVGTASNPEWLALRVANGDVTLNGNVSLYGYVIAPNGGITLNGKSQLIGGATSDRLTLNGNSLLRAINLSPTVSVSTPADGAVLTAPIASLLLTASATDPDGYLTKVEFFSGATKLGESTAAPYEFTWTGIPAGTYAITAKATDNSGGSTTSSPVTLIANAPPSVALTAPANNAVFAAPGTFTLSATALDSDGTVVKVEFFEGGVKIGESTVPPYQVAVSGLTSGTYTFAARATDNEGASTDSDPRSIIVELPPTAALAAPATISRGSGITLTGTASDADGTVAKVEFYRGPKLLGTLTTPTGTPPAYVFTDTDTLPPGPYSYTIRSYDNLGLYTDSTVTTVTILATLPYTADFEVGEGYALGAVGGQLGWTATSDSASITDEIAFNGVHSVALAPGTPPVRVAQVFAPYPDHDVVFMDFFARPVAEPDVTNSTTFDVEGARFAFVQNGTTGVLNVYNGDGAGGGIWQATSFSAPLTADNQQQTWTRLTARLDFAHKTWDLYAGGAMVAADIKFRDNSATYLSSFAVRGDAATISRLDYIFAGADNPLFVDTNNNGIDDAWETAHGLSLTTNNRTDDPDGDGISNLNEYVGGTDPNDYYNGRAPVVAIVSGDNQVAAPANMNPQPLVVVVKDTASQGSLRNAPVTFAVVTGFGGLARAAGTDGLASTLLVRTDDVGQAKVYFWQPNADGVVSAITASASSTVVTFHSTSQIPNRPPAVVISAPSNGMIVSAPASVQLTATANDPDGTVARVEFYRDGTLIGSVPTSSASPPTFNFSDPDIHQKGIYTYVARCYDNLGAATDSSPVTVTVTEPEFDFKGEQPVLRLVSGGNQPKASGYLPQPIIIAVFHADGATPWPMAPVTLNVEYGKGGWAAVAGGPISQAITVNADANGVVKAFYWLP